MSKTHSSISIHSLICFAPSGDHSPSAPQTISKNCAKMLPQPGLLLWNCPQRCRQVQWQGELVWLTWRQLGSRQIELGVGFGCRRCMKIKHWQWHPALQKFSSRKLKMLQTGTPGFAGQNLTNVSGVKHATCNTQPFLPPGFVALWCSQNKKRQNVTCQQGLRVAVGRGAIPCHLQSHCANGLGHGMVTAGKESGGYHNRADIIWIFVGRFSSLTCPAN